MSKPKQSKSDAVANPAHYGGVDNPYEVIKVITAWDLGFDLGNTVKYIARAGKKDPRKVIEDLEKAAWYLRHRIDVLRSTPPVRHKSPSHSVARHNRVSTRASTKRRAPSNVAHIGTGVMRSGAAS